MIVRSYFLPTAICGHRKKLNEMSKKAMGEKNLDEHKTSSELYEELGIWWKLYKSLKNVKKLKTQG